MNTDKNRELLWRTVPFVMAMLLLALTGIPLRPSSDGRKRRLRRTRARPSRRASTCVSTAASPTGTLAAIDREGGEVSFAIAEQPSKGTVTLDGETFVYTSAKNKTGVDRFTYTATDAAGSTSAPAEVRITIARAKCGVTYDDMAESAAYTAAVDLAEHGVFVGAQVGSRRFFEPDRAVSRGEFVTMALACAGIPAGDLMMTGFCDDAEILTWAKGSAVSALQCGLIRGVGTEGGMAFCADEGVTLSEAATVLNRLLRVTDVTFPTTTRAAPTRGAHRRWRILSPSA